MGTSHDRTLLFCSSDFDTNEKKIMDELDKLARQTQKGKKGGSMSDAAGGAEEIRGWVSTWPF